MLATTLDIRYGLRKRLLKEEYHTSTTKIPRSALTPDKEPQIAATIHALAVELVANPRILLEDSYTDAERSKDWKNLSTATVLDTSGNILPITTRMRPGHNILDHHMPHFYNVKNHRGESVRSSITVPILEKALWVNICNHSTPYKSEIRRMITNTCALGSVTKYRAVLARAIISYYNAHRVFDPCIGWGGRMLGAISVPSVTAYVGCEPDPLTIKGLRDILLDTTIPADRRAVATVHETPCEAKLDALAAGEPFDMILTSPPYFNLELYSGDHQSTEHHPTWDSWVNEWLKPVILKSLRLLKPGGVSCWSVKNFKSDRQYHLADTVKQIHHEAGWTLTQTVVMRGCGRMGVNRIDQEGRETRRSEEETFCFTSTPPAAVAPAPIVAYETMSMATLRDLWRQKGYRGFTTKTKDELVERLRNPT